MGIFQTYVLEIFVTHVRSKMVGKPYEGCFIIFFHLWIQLVSEKGGGRGGEGGGCIWEQQNPMWLVVVVAFPNYGLFAFLQPLLSYKIITI
jgi:hypothetical protein